MNNGQEQFLAFFIENTRPKNKRKQKEFYSRALHSSKQKN
jgi:hypothetical protein